MNIANLLDNFTEAERDAFNAALPAYLTQQRWFGAKSRTITSASFGRITRLASPTALLAMIEVAYTDGTAETYQLPLAAKPSFPSSSPVSLATNASEPRPIFTANNVTYYDAIVDAPFRAELLALAAAGADSVTAPLPSRVASAEQSNTSIIFGDKRILKLFRKLQAGENPDVEISRFLTTVAHFAHIPAYRGQLTAEDGTTLAFLQDFAPNQGDGWEWMLAQLHLPSTGASIEGAQLLGQRTAEMHLALATETSDANFCAQAFTPNDLAVDAARLQTQVESTLDALKRTLPRLPAEQTGAAAALLGKRAQLLSFAQQLATASPFRMGRRIRIHGDFHLGQTLRTKEDSRGDFLIVDFEGEPARPLDQRRRKQSALRDVAGMLRSFSYVAATASAPDTWLSAASEAFLTAYNASIAAHPELLPQGDHAALLLRVFLLEKALYELLYELNNRPSWVPIPLRGLSSLLGEAA